MSNLVEEVKYELFSNISIIYFCIVLRLQRGYVECRTLQAERISRAFDSIKSFNFFNFPIY